MWGTVVNAAAIVAGGLIGLLCKKGIRENWTESINRALGVAVLIIGFNGAVANMFTIGEDGTLSSSGELLLVISLVLGTLLGEVLRLDDRLGKLSANIERRFKVGGFAASFMNSTILCCVGAMAIIGSINDGLTGDATVLYLKSSLDFISAIVFGATLGFGVIFSAVPVLIYQGAISLLAGLVSGFLMAVMPEICMVGYAIILCIGLNFLLPKRIKTLNMLPAVLVPAVWSGIQALLF